MKFKVSGLKEIDRALGELPKAVAKRLLRQIGIDALQPAAAAMRSRAPRDKGDLIEGITVGTALSRSQKRYAGLGGKRRNPDMVVVYAGPGSHPQAVLQEIGTFKEPPQPYVAPAFDAEARDAADFVTNNLHDRVMKSAARLAKKGKIRSA